MAINPVILPKFEPTHANLLGTDFARPGDNTLRFAEFPVELIRFTGDGALTTVDVTTGFSRVLGGMVFNVTDGTVSWTSVAAKPHASNPAQMTLTSIPADTDVYLLIVWGDKAQVPAP